MKIPSPYKTIKLSSRKDLKVALITVYKQKVQMRDKELLFSPSSALKSNYENLWIKRARNDLPCTNIDNLLPAYDLSTINKQIITYTDGSFDPTGYLYSPIQPFGCIEPLAL
ncbi:hypothetical protein [Clostridium formicaceticum]|uniref:hypothetical protein n=1 Tax=Clostridium formicaceticum TaxID=1497 RepID=UPI0014711D63|nr:hypothetical protein [Clostridium formicaceticum]